MPAPGGTITPHLWVVVTEPDAATHLCVIVSVTTLRNSKDQTILLRPGDHPFIRHDSTVFYGDAMIVDVRRLDAEVAAGLALVRMAFSHRPSPGPRSSASAEAIGRDSAPG